jgi:bacterioferritin
MKSLVCLPGPTRHARLARHAHPARSFHRAVIPARQSQQELPMSAKSNRLTLADRAASAGETLTLDQGALDRARKNLDEGAVTPSYGPWREQIVKLLNDALATELVCVLRYKRHHFTARGMASPKIAEEFMVHAQEETGHGDRLAERIVQLGGEPDFSPATLLDRSHADYDESADLKAMVRANLVAERVAVESYRQMIDLIGDKDPTTRRLLEDILKDEEEHADELADMLDQ